MSCYAVKNQLQSLLYTDFLHPIGEEVCPMGEEIYSINKEKEFDRFNYYDIMYVRLKEQCQNLLNGNE